MSQVIEDIFSAPAHALDKTVDTSRQLNSFISQAVPLHKAKNYWKNLGPGLTTGAADDDPSGIATYSQAGAQYGMQFAWLAVFTFPLMAVVQEMCARIGIVTGRGLAANIRIVYPRWLLHVCTILLFCANTLNLGADLGAMAQASRLLVDLPTYGLLIFFALFVLLLQIYSTYDKFAKYLKWLAMLLLSYVVTAFFVELNWTEVLKGAFIPNLKFWSKDAIFLICAILGTTISPYSIFLADFSRGRGADFGGQNDSASCVRRVTTPKEITDMRVDVWSGMFLSNLVMFFIIMVCAFTLNSAGITNITSASDAANALKPLAGDKAYLLFTLGILGTGSFGNACLGRVGIICNF
jgi:NRAMP (natural resistance-associated macrophage protein)-like metal ion transporter